MVLLKYKKTTCKFDKHGKNVNNISEVGGAAWTGFIFSIKRTVFSQDIAQVGVQTQPKLMVFQFQVIDLEASQATLKLAQILDCSKLFLRVSVFTFSVVVFFFKFLPINIYPFTELAALGNVTIITF